MATQHPLNALQRIKLLFIKDWTLQRKALLSLSLTFILSLTATYVIPLLFGQEWTVWCEDAKDVPFLIINTILAPLAFFFYFLTWINKSIHKSETEPFTNIPATVGEKYMTIFMMGILFLICSIVVGWVTTLLRTAFVPGAWSEQLHYLSAKNITITGRESHDFIWLILFAFSYALFFILLCIVAQFYFHHVFVGILIPIFIVSVGSSLSLFIAGIFNLQTSLYLSTIVCTLLSIGVIILGYFILKKMQLK